MIQGRIISGSCKNRVKSCWGSHRASKHHPTDHVLITKRKTNLYNGVIWLSPSQPSDKIYLASPIGGHLKYILWGDVKWSSQYLLCSILLKLFILNIIIRKQSHKLRLFKKKKKPISLKNKQTGGFIIPDKRDVLEFPLWLVQWLKNLTVAALSLWRHGFNPQPGNFHMPQVWP